MKKLQAFWQPVPGYESYYVVSPCGSIKSLHKHKGGKILNQRIGRGGYLTSKLSLCGKDSTRNIHRILAEAFIPNPDNKPFVNHKNGNKLDNRLENLEWVTHAENMRHAFSLGLCEWSKKPVINICTGQRFESIKEAASFYGLPYFKCKAYLAGYFPNPTYLRLELKIAA